MCVCVCVYVYVYKRSGPCFIAQYKKIFYARISWNYALAHTPFLRTAPTSLYDISERAISRDAGDVQFAAISRGKCARSCSSTRNDCGSHVEKEHSSSRFLSSVKRKERRRDVCDPSNDQYVYRTRLVTSYAKTVCERTLTSILRRVSTLPSSTADCESSRRS